VALSQQKLAAGGPLLQCWHPSGKAAGAQSAFDSRGPGVWPPQRQAGTPMLAMGTIAAARQTTTLVAVFSKNRIPKPTNRQPMNIDATVRRHTPKLPLQSTHTTTQLYHLPALAASAKNGGSDRMELRSHRMKASIR
jgi:hypothetical protein